MKFKGEPNLIVRINKPMRGEVKSFKFDGNGIYETNHPTTIRRLQAKFEEVKEIEIRLKHCKKCDFTCDNQGELLKHYRETHPKEE
jgi:hypothetical protein